MSSIVAPSAASLIASMNGTPQPILLPDPPTLSLVPTDPLAHLTHLTPDEGNYYDDSDVLPPSAGKMGETQIEFDLIASILHDSTQFGDVNDITPNMFGDPNLREIWAYVFDKKGRVAPSALKNALEKTPAGRRALQEIGNGKSADETINFLFQQGRFAGAADSLAPVLRNCATLRFVEQAHRDIVPDRFSDSSEYVSALSARLHSIASRMAPSIQAESLSQGADKALESFLWSAANPGKMTGMKIGLDDYDMAMGGVQPGEVIMYGGHSGEGKTQLKCFMAISATMIKDDLTGQYPNVMFFSLEMSPEQMAQRWISKLSQVSLRERNPTPDQTRAVKKAHKTLNELAKSGRLTMLDSSGASSLDQIVRAIHRGKEENNITAAYVDYAQLIGVGNRGGDSSKYEQMALVAQKLKLTAQQLGIFIGVGVQLNRDAMSSTSAGRPKLYHIADSLDLVRSADGVQMIWTPARHIGYKAGPWAKIAVLLTEKMRSRPAINDLFYNFDPSVTSFYEVDPAVRRVLLSDDSQELLKNTRVNAAASKKAP